MPAANGNWKTPINFADGTIHFRATISKMPTNKLLKMQFCIWQESVAGEGYANEICSELRNFDYKGQPVTDYWSTPLADMYQISMNPIDWTRPRQRYAGVIKNSAGNPVTDYSNWNWSGENPGHWYPMELRFTAVVVETGKTFSGWVNYP